MRIQVNGFFFLSSALELRSECLYKVDDLRVQVRQDSGVTGGTQSSELHISAPSSAPCRASHLRGSQRGALPADAQLILTEGKSPMFRF